MSEPGAPRMFEPTTDTQSPAYRIPGSQPPPAPAAYGPPPTPPGPPAPPRKPSFWSTSAGGLVIAGAVIVAIMGAVAVGLLLRSQRRADLDVTVVSCEFHGSTATVGYTVQNTGDSAHDVTLKIEYRDGSGARIDTDTAYVRGVPPGDTVRGEESTFLDAPTTSGRCLVTY